MHHIDAAAPTVNPRDDISLYDLDAWDGLERLRDVAEGDVAFGRLSKWHLQPCLLNRCECAINTNKFFPYWRVVRIGTGEGRKSGDGRAYNLEW